MRVTVEQPTDELPGQRLASPDSAILNSYDLLTPEGNEPVLKKAYLSQRPRSKKNWREIMANEKEPAWGFYLKLRKNKKFISKGQFAHDVALSIEDGEEFKAPDYLDEAIRGVLEDGTGGTI